MCHFDDKRVNPSIMIGKNDKIKAKYYKNAEFGKKRIEYIKYFTNSPLTEN